MNYQISEIVKIAGATLLNENLIPATIEDIYFDTRRTSKGNSSLFLAIDGKNADGHAYIHQAFQQLGTRNFLVSKPIDTSKYPDANFLLCVDVIAGLQKLALHHRQRFDIPIIGITGSNGKTIIKEWIFQICEHHLKTTRSPKSYNSQLGVPLSVLKLQDKDELGIFEAGISNAGEMEKLADIIQPTIGIISNIGDAHSAGFSSKLQKLREKLSLFTHAEKVIYCKDDQLIHQNIQNVGLHLISWSTNDQSATYFIRYDGNNVVINNSTYSIPFEDPISRINAVFAIVTALEIGLSPPSKIELKALKMRLEMKEGINGCFLINDAYNSDIEALSSALSIMDQQQKKEKNTLILSQIEESSLENREAINIIADLIKNHNVDRLITIGDKIKDIQVPIEHRHFQDTTELLLNFDHLNFENENILIKGARKYNLEKVFDLLSTKVHQTILEINLEAMRHNLKIYRSFLNASTKLMVVLKASGYGSGSNELARFLTYQRIDYIAVAYADEGVELRNSGIKLPIMVMNAQESSWTTMLRYQLEPEIYSINQLKSYISYIDDGLHPIHLKIETGMHRLGIHLDDISAIGHLLQNNNHLHVQSVFSHFVGSDDPQLDHFSHQQVEVFMQAYNALCQYIDYTPDRHILNSNGISRFPNYQFEMVRLGIGLHGITDDPTLKKQLQKVQKLTTKIAQIKTLESKDSVGYNRTYITDTPRKIGTINIGYADGLPRNAGNKRFSVLVINKTAPILGNVCMDMCMIDLTKIQANEGDEVVIFGPEWPIEKLAEACNTIPYEILTRLSSRVHRIFSRE